MPAPQLRRCVAPICDGNRKEIVVSGAAWYGLMQMVLPLLHARPIDLAEFSFFSGWWSAAFLVVAAPFAENSVLVLLLSGLTLFVAPGQHRLVLHALVLAMVLLHISYGVIAVSVWYPFYLVGKSWLMWRDLNWKYAFGVGWLVHGLFNLSAAIAIYLQVS